MLHDKDHAILGHTSMKAGVFGYKETPIKQITFKELRTFKQCYTDNPNDKYYTVRKQLPQYWFLSERGTLVSCASGKVRYVQPTTRPDNNREYYKINYRRQNISVDALYNLVFGGRSSAAAEALLNEHGLDAMKRSGRRALVECHHIKNAVYNETQFLTANEHDIITHSTTPEAEIDKIRRSIIKVNKTIDRGLIVIGGRDGAGYITDTVTEGLQPRAIAITEATRAVFHKCGTIEVAADAPLPEKDYNNILLMMGDIKKPAEIVYKNIACVLYPTK